MDMRNPITSTLKCASQGVLSHRCLRKASAADSVITGFEGSAGIAELGTVRRRQRRYPEALASYAEARERFTQLDEPGSVAVIWHQTGTVYQEAGQPEAAEDAYRKSLAIKVRLGNVRGQAKTLNHLGILYDDDLGRTEEAVACFCEGAARAGGIDCVAEKGRA